MRFVAGEPPARPYTMWTAMPFVVDAMLFAVTHCVGAYCIRPHRFVANSIVLPNAMQRPTLGDGPPAHLYTQCRRCRYRCLGAMPFTMKRATICAQTMPD